MASKQTSEERRAEALIRAHGVQTLHRPETGTTPTFPLRYVRRKLDRSGGLPVVVIPGGPGLASVTLYERLRRSAAEADLDVLMVEHRGVGLSRRDAGGHDLPFSAMTVRQAAEDILAVLDEEGVDEVVIAGSSYGSYLAQAVASLAPERVARLVLDSPMLSAAEDIVTVREHARSLLWRGEHPETARIAAKIRVLVERDGVAPLPLGLVVRVLHEFGGPGLVDRFLDQKVVARSRLTERLIHQLADQETTRRSPFAMEFDLVGALATRELGYGRDPDGLIFDPAADSGGLGEGFPAFEGEEFDHAWFLASFRAPVVVVSGDRDLRTPRPVAERIAALAPHGILVPLHEAGHSALDTRSGAFLEVLRAVASGIDDDLEGLPSRSEGLSALPAGGGGSHLLDRIAGAVLAADRVVTPLAPRVPRTSPPAGQ